MEKCTKRTIYNNGKGYISEFCQACKDEMEYEGKYSLPICKKCLEYLGYMRKQLEISINNVGTPT